MSFKVKVLSIDGGGIRGIIPSVILAEIEQRTQKRIFELFDLVAGTSTGGILALGLTKPEPYSASKLIEIYKDTDNRKSLFTRNRLNILTQNLLGYKYGRRKKIEILNKYLGDNVYIDEAQIQNKTEVIVTSYDAHRKVPILFTSDSTKEIDNPNIRKICKGVKIWEAAMATSAAPTYFKPYLLSKNSDPKGYMTLIDGGIIANNPTLLATIEAMISYQNKAKEELNLNEVLVVSLGTGSHKSPYDYESMKKWGRVDWAIPFIDMTFDGQDSIVDCQMRQLMSLKYGDINPITYYRFQPFFTDNKSYYRNLSPVSQYMDDTSDENVRSLEKVAKNFIKEKETTLTELCNLLTKDK